MSSNPSISDVIHEVISAEKQRLVPFLGSAASLFEPTSLPSWIAFLKEIITALQEQAFSQPDPDAVQIDFLGTLFAEIESGRFKPYDVTEILVRRLGEDYMTITSTFLGHQPNMFHLHVADCLLDTTFPAVVTTNFDKSVEAALQARGATICELTGDPEKDRQLLEDQSQLGQRVNPVVVRDFESFKVVNEFLSLIGRGTHCFIFKIHGDAELPRSCVDTAMQRAQGLPSTVTNVLSVLLQRFSIFFIGFGGGDLDKDMNYLRLRSEKDLAKVYWLIRPVDQEPAVFTTLRSNLGSKFIVVHSQINGRITGNNPLLKEKMKAWAAKIGPHWTRLALLDLAEVAKLNDTVVNELLRPLRKFGSSPAASASALGEADLPTKGRVADMIGVFQRPGATSAAPRAAPQQQQQAPAKAQLNSIIAGLPNLSEPARAQLEIVAQFERAKEAYAGGDIPKALEYTTRSILAQRKQFPDSRFFPDSYCSLILYALCLDSLGDEANAIQFLSDAKDVAILAGNLEGVHAVEAVLKKHPHLSKVSSRRSSAAPAPALPAKAQAFSNETLVFIPAFDNVGDLFKGVPTTLMLRAHLHRALLAGDRVAIASNFLLNSKVFITEVLFNEAEELNEEYLYHIRPVIPLKQAVNKGGVNVEHSFKEMKTPLLTFRLECQVNNPAYLHEPIEARFIEKIDLFYQRYPELLYWYDFKAIAGTYASRTRALVQHPETASLFQGNQLPFFQELVEPTTSFIDVCLGGGYLTRSQLYKYGNLFNEATSQEAFQKEFGALLEKTQNPELGQRLATTRQRIANKPWMYASILRDLSDSPYVTNLPLAFDFSLCVDAKEERLFQLISPVIAAEGASKKLGPRVHSHQVRVVELANIPPRDLIALRSSREGEAFRQELRVYRQGLISSPDRVNTAAKDLQRALEGLLTPVDDRPLVKVDILRLAEPTKPADPSVVDHLLMVPALTFPMPPNYEIPLINFPGVIPIVKVAKEAEPGDVPITRLEQVVAYADPSNKWVQLYFDRVRFQNGQEGRYNILVENGGKPGVVLLPLQGEAGSSLKIGLIETYRYPVQSWSWEVPRGGGEPGSTELESAMRELWEETGHTTDSPLVPLTKGNGLFQNDGVSNSEVTYWAALNVRPLDAAKGEKVPAEDTEAIRKFQFFTVGEIFEMIQQGQIRDSFTICVLALAGIARLIPFST